jgi:hypothetical protein
VKVRRSSVVAISHPFDPAVAAAAIGEAYPSRTAKAVERLARCFLYVWRWALKKTDARVSAQRLCYKGAHGPSHVDGSSGPCPPSSRRRASDISGMSLTATNRAN